MWSEVGTHLAYFNPRAPQGARLHRKAQGEEGGKFQSTRSARSATQLSIVATHGATFQSTRSARSATKEAAFLCLPRRISIHALRKERDLRR